MFFSSSGKHTYAVLRASNYKAATTTTFDRIALASVVTGVQCAHTLFRFCVPMVRLRIFQSIVKNVWSFITT